ncbi:hypothetical protein [Ornithinimicrobium kibberense]|uniref:hypothetical protein n=1 Tax=Ornithinimicrobium kibberense TaxID=282060 RepID=UPI00360AC91C
MAPGAGVRDPVIVGSVRVLLVSAGTVVGRAFRQLFLILVWRFVVPVLPASADRPCLSLGGWFGWAARVGPVLPRGLSRHD